MSAEPREVTLAVSPDADDLFMVRALLEGALPTPGYRFRIESTPTDALNRLASGRTGPDVVAVSIAHYPAIADRYQLLPHGGSVGEGYGPVVVAREPLAPEALHGRRLAIPGVTTTAWMALQLILGGEIVPKPVVVPISPHERVFEALDEGKVDAALLIHEGRLTWPDRGLHSVVELGESWSALTGGLPLPLGGNVIKRSLGLPTIREISGLLRESIAWALEHRDDSIRWLLERGSALRTEAEVSRYLDMYANARTLDYGEVGREAIRDLFQRAGAIGLVSRPPPLDFAP
ncbi:MAG: MqnA/MqnD/SBP family protein [Myxococcota bacterium]